MKGTIQPERPRTERRKKSRVHNTKFNYHERMEFVYWYGYILRTLGPELRGKKFKTFSFKAPNRDCKMPKKKVRNELVYIFNADWQCKLSFDLKDKSVHLINRSR